MWYLGGKIVLSWGAPRGIQEVVGELTHSGHTRSFNGDREIP